MGVPYDPHEIEARWRLKWQEAGTGLVDLDHVDPARAFTNLVEFPYPSAEGLHIGHVFRYGGADAYGRYQRARGRQVFQPIGFDAFGIHTENFALQRGQHPRELTGRTTERFRAQLSRIGAAWDWRVAVDTSQPRYYRWTQWVFLQLFRAGLAYQAEAPATWCPACLTVLAREQTETVDGVDVCERCATPVGERVMRQWFLRITAYADRLLAGLDELDWPERSKRLQRAWIGRSEGREILFGDLVVFTTRPDTLPGVTFLAVAPGHPAAGSTRPHPLTGAPLLVCEADYVVGDYGTGVVMGVPAHDERDARFAAAHGLPVSDAALLDAGQAAAVGEAAVRYRLRDWLISRQRYWGPPIPIVHCEVCGPVPVADSELPVLLPDVDDVRPTGTGVSPLAAAAEFVAADCPSCGGPGQRETDVSDTFLDSAWYFLRYPSADFDDRPWDDARTRRWLPVGFYAGGAEHVQRHHLYARFVTMALHDLGLVPFEEPFPRIRLGGFIVHEGAKMSKSRGNVVDPDTLIDAYGTDVVRCALLFTAPWYTDGDFRMDALAGIERFLTRVWRAVARSLPEGPSGLDRQVVEVGEAIERLQLNVGLARLMEAVAQVSTAAGQRVLVRLLAPFAPHLAEELWCRLGQSFSVHDQPWPEVDPEALTQHSVEIGVQVDGRLRARVRLPAGAPATAAEAAARAHPDVGRWLDRPVARVVHVPDRLVNLVLGDGDGGGDGS